MMRSTLIAAAVLLAAGTAGAAQPTYSVEGVPATQAFAPQTTGAQRTTQISGTARDGFLRDENGYSRTEVNNGPSGQQAGAPRQHLRDENG